MEPKTQTTYYFSGPLGMGPASPRPRGHSSRTSLGTGGSSSLLSPAWVEVKDLPNNSWGCQRSSNNPKTIPRGSLDTISGVWQEKESQTIFFFSQLQCQRLILSISVPAHGRELFERILDNPSKTNDFIIPWSLIFLDALQYQF